MTTYDTLRCEKAAPRIARIVVDRPESRNAQNTRLLYELDDAFDHAAGDDEISVIVLAAAGPHFSAGHDLREHDPAQAMRAHRRVGTWAGFDEPGAAGWMAREAELYLGLCERWRNIPKPVLAEVQGKVIAGGLMLMWPCDIVVAADDAEFIDNTVAMGVCGAEFFQHPWEVGVRKAKEMLFTSAALSAAEAWRLGMVNHVVPPAELTSFTMRVAAEIAQRPLFALRLAKQAVNTAQDNQGRPATQRTAFALHQLCHSHNQQVHGTPIDPGFLQRNRSRN
jgi:enoyl-CoA hydratase